MANQEVEGPGILVALHGGHISRPLTHRWGAGRMNSITDTRAWWKNFLPDSATTGWVTLALLLGFAGAGLVASSEFQHIDESFFAAKPIFWVMYGAFFFGLALIRFLLSFFKPYTIFSPDKNKEIFIVFQIMLFLSFLIFSFGLTPYLNRILDNAKPQPIKLTVIDKFKMELGTKGFYPRPTTLFFIGFNAPYELRTWGLVLVDEKHEKESPIFKKFYLGESFVINGHPGKFGLPWFDFKHQPQLTKFVHNDSQGTDLRHMELGKTSVAKEVLQRQNVEKVLGILGKNSQNKKILEEWKIPVEPTFK